MEAVLVDIVSRVVTPSATLAGTAWKYHSCHMSLTLNKAQVWCYFWCKYWYITTFRYLGVDPEGEPGDDDEHAGGNVDGEHVVRELPLQCQLHQQAAVLPWTHICNKFCPKLMLAITCPLNTQMIFAINQIISKLWRAINLNIKSNPTHWSNSGLDKKWRWH